MLTLEPRGTYWRGNAEAAWWDERRQSGRKRDGGAQRALKFARHSSWRASLLSFSCHSFPSTRFFLIFLSFSPSSLLLSSLAALLVPIIADLPYFFLDFFISAANVISLFPCCRRLSSAFSFSYSYSFSFCSSFVCHFFPITRFVTRICGEDDWIWIKFPRARNGEFTPGILRIFFLLLLLLLLHLSHVCQFTNYFENCGRDLNIFLIRVLELVSKLKLR